MKCLLQLQILCNPSDSLRNKVCQACCLEELLQTYQEVYDLSAEPMAYKIRFFVRDNAWIIWFKEARRCSFYDHPSVADSLWLDYQAFLCRVCFNLKYIHSHNINYGETQEKHRLTKLFINVLSDTNEIVNHFKYENETMNGNVIRKTLIENFNACSFCT